MKYFAYGSNMDPNRMKKRGINFSKREHAILKKWKLKFNKTSSQNPLEGYANIVPDETGNVEGVLYDIQDSDIFKLDVYEGCPEHYGRIKIKVIPDEGQEVEAETYVSQPGQTSDGLKPSRQYLDYLLKAVDLLSAEYYDWLTGQETQDGR